MLRFLAFLLLIAGLGVAAFGGYRLWLADQDGSAPAATVEEAVVEPVAVEPVAVGAVAVEPDPVAEVSEEEEVAERQSAFLGEPEEVLVQSTSVNRGLPAQPQTRAARSRSIAAPAEQGPSFRDRLQQVPVAYETPTSVSFGKTFQVNFAVDGTGDGSAADALMVGENKVVEGEAMVSERIQASLIGPAFQIEATTPSVQLLSSEQENVWRWNVTALEEGAHVLFVELYALKGEEALPVRTFQDEIVVTVGDFQRLVHIANHLNPIAIVISGLGTAIGGLFAFLRLVRRRRKNKLG